jgi:hypothetical protein
MSLFDNLRCEYPLPDGWEPGTILFQTKDTPEQYLACYVLTREGRLQHATTGEVIPFHGALTFYTTNITGVSPRGCITRDDTAPWWAEYCALFDHGTLLKIEGQRAPYTRHGPHLSRADFYNTTQATKED